MHNFKNSYHITAFRTTTDVHEILDTKKLDSIYRLIVV